MGFRPRLEQEAKPTPFPNDEFERTRFWVFLELSGLGASPANKTPASPSAAPVWELEKELAQMLGGMTQYLFLVFIVVGRFGPTLFQ